MAFNFPNAPVEGQVYTPSGGPDYIWRNPKWEVSETVIDPTDVISVERFGGRSVLASEMAGLSNAAALALANDSAFKAALDYAEAKGGGYVEARGQVYILGTTGLRIPEGVFLRGDGNGSWDTTFHDRPKTWAGTNLIFKGTGAKSIQIRGITSCEHSGGWRGGFKLTTLMNANASGTTPATPKAISAAISAKVPGSRNWGVLELRVVPWMGADGIAGYSNTANTSLGDNWDVGILVENGEYCEFVGVQSVGYWRQYGFAMINPDFDQAGAQERNRIENCKFQGHTGLAIRGGEQIKVITATASTLEIPWTAESPWADSGYITGLPDPPPYTRYTYTGTERNGANIRFTGVTPNCAALTQVRAPFRATGGAGSYFLNVMSTPLNHVSGQDAEALGLGPSRALEMSGFPLRGIQFLNYKAQSIGETLLAFFHDVQDPLFVQCQFEGPGALIASPLASESTAPYPAGDTRHMRWLSTIRSGSVETWFTPRSFYNDVDQMSFDQFSDDFKIQPQPGRDVQVFTRSGKSFYVRRSDGVTNSLRVTDAGNVIVENAGQFSLSGGSARINVDTGQAFELRHGTTPRLTLFSSGNITPGADNTQTFGSAPFRWSQFFAGTATINTSDVRQKSDIGAIPDEWLDAWGEVEWQRFKFNDAIAAKGDAARWHSGLVAQRVEEIFNAHGLDARSVGLLCYDEWDDLYGPEEEEVVHSREIVAEDGTVSVEETREIVPTGNEILVRAAGNSYGLRYEECLAFEAAWTRRELARLKTP